MAESEEELKSLLRKVKVETENVGLKLITQFTFVCRYVLYISYEMIMC